MSVPPLTVRLALAPEVPSAISTVPALVSPPVTVRAAGVAWSLEIRRNRPPAATSTAAFTTLGACTCNVLCTLRAVAIVSVPRTRVGLAPATMSVPGPLTVMPAPKPAKSSTGPPPAYVKSLASCSAVPTGSRIVPLPAPPRTVPVPTTTVPPLTVSTPLAADSDPFAVVNVVPVLMMVSG